MPTPALAAQIKLDSTMDGVTCADGANSGADAMETDIYHFLVSNVTTDNNGRSLLRALKNAWDNAAAAASPPITVAFTVVLTSDYKIKITHNHANTMTLTLESATLQANLGFASGNISVPTGASGLTAPNRSRYWWSPDMWISGGEFDPAVTHAFPTSAGSAQRAPDGTAAYTQNSVQRGAYYKFNAVQYYYKIFPTTGYTNEDWVGFWETNLTHGRRVLMWRDRDDAVGSSEPDEGSATPYNYVEYQPTEKLRADPMITMAAPPNVVYWDVEWDFWMTERGETPYTDSG